MIRQRPGIRFKGSGTVRIESLSHDARGVGHVEGKTVFVEGALPGELVEYGLLRSKSSFDNGSVTRVIEASPDRVLSPRCEHFGICGGCSLQHLQDAAQLRYKQQIVLENFDKIGKVQPQTWLEPLTSASWGYRRKARIGARLVPKKGGVLVGFREKRSAYITDIEYCHVLDARVATLLPAMHQLIGGLSCPDQIPQIEVAAGDEEVVLVFRHLVAFTREDLADLTAFSRSHNVQVWLQPGGPDSVKPLWPEKPPALKYFLPEFDVEIQFRPTDFTQVNVEVNRKMVARAIDLLELQEGDEVLDLFCGLGNFTLPLARQCDRVLGIEGDETLVAGARDNARRNAIGNARFVTGDLYQETELPPWGNAKFNKVLIDPPRSGALEVIKHIPANGPERIVYVSCYPSTLARDADYLVNELGYHFEAACVMDMFPQTSHVESIALFTRKH
ncbi:MAG: 23S rRNA methyltransferase [Acidithiobacillales bacterium SG8_45]|nr:MAG: 23S rRNA methyltransferase [Acidithiobacillales bacterium SG8_45]